MADLKLVDVRKTYGSMEILHGIDLDIRSGEFIVFVGPSGCGKSTLLRAIAGLEDISSGEFYIDGALMNDIAPLGRGIAMVFQSYALYPHMTVFDNMAFGMKIAGMKKAEIRTRVQRAAGILQLAPYLDRYPKALSGGQRQRVAIGRAIVRDPRVFLFDEPLSNLDAALRVATRIEIARLKQSMPDTTMIYVTHDQVEAMTLADRIVVLRDGRIEQVGTPIELYERPANIFVAQFIGSPAMNILDATVAGDMDDIVLDVAAGDRVSAGPRDRNFRMGAPLRIGIRPENLKVADQGQPVVSRGEVSLIENLGEVQFVYIAVDGREEPLLMKTAGRQIFSVGQTLSVTAASDAMYLFDADGIAVQSA